MSVLTIGRQHRKPPKTKHGRQSQKRFDYYFLLFLIYQYSILPLSTTVRPKMLRERSKSVHDREKENSPEVSEASSNRKRPLLFVTPNPNEKSVAPAKRKAILKHNHQSDPTNSMAEIVATNCTLSNNMIELTHKLLDKQSDYDKLMIHFFAGKKEKWFLKQKLARRDSKINELERALKDLKESRFCEDLIRINDEPAPNDQSKIVIIIMLL